MLGKELELWGKQNLKLLQVLAFKKKAGGRLALSLYVFLHTASFHFELLEHVHVELFGCLDWVQDNSAQNQLGPHKNRAMPTQPKIHNSAQDNSVQFLVS